MGSKSSKAGTKTSNSDDIVIDSKKGVVNISGRNGHRYTNVRTFYTEYYSDGTKKLENVVDISSEYNSKIPRYLNDLDANQQSKYKVKVPLPDPTPYKTNNSQMKRTNGVVIHSDDNNLLDNNGMVIELEAGGKRQKREHHFTGLLTIADQHKALCKYECKQARDHLSTEVTVNSLDFTHQAGQNMCIRNASLSIETTERGCEQECETETIVPVGEPIVEQFHEEHAAILQSIQSSLSDVYACDKLAKVFQNYNDNDSSIETVEEILIHDADEDSGTLGRCSFYGQESIECRCIGTFSNTSSMDSSLTFRKVLVLGVDKLEFSRKANNSMIATEPGPILRFPVINEASRENIYIQRPETEWPRPIDMTVPESCQFEMPNIAKYEPDEQHHRLVNACNSSYPPDMKVLLNVILLFILVYYKHENTAEEEDAKRNDTLEHREVSFESDQGYGSIMSLRSEHLTQRCQGMPTTGPKDDGSSIPQLKLKNALKECIGFDFATCIASCDPIIAFPGLNGYFDRLRSGRAITERERMSYEWLRLMTFASYNGNGCPVHLARSGFYHTGLNEIRCFCCDTSYLDWEATDEVEQTHRRVSPACPFIVGGIDAAGNIAIDECVEESREEEEGHILLERQEISLRGSERRGQYPRHENAINRSSTDVSLEQRARNGYAINNGEGYGITYDGNLARDRNTGPNGNSAVSGRNSEPDSQTRNNRIDTTLGSNLPHGSITASDSRGNEYVARGRSRFADQDNIINRIQEISPASNDISGQTSMVEYITQDFTTNTTPSRPHSGFNSDDDVYGAAGYGIGSADTSRISGITNEGGSDETYLEEEVNDSLSSEDRAPPFQDNLLRMDGRTQSSDSRTIEHVDDLLGRARHQNYRTIHARRDSFATWPTDIDVDIHHLAVSGFYYLGRIDFVACFYCGGGLRAWQSGVNPYVEHARWYPTCDYLKRLKGNEFIKQVTENTCTRRRRTSCHPQCTCSASRRQTTIPIPSCYQTMPRRSLDSREETVFVSNYRSENGQCSPRHTVSGTQDDGLASQDKNMDCMQASDTSLTNRSRSVMEIRHTAELNNNIPDKSMKDIRQDKERYCSVANRRMNRYETLGSTVNASTGTAERRGVKPNAKRDGSSAEDAFRTSMDESSGAKTKHDQQIAVKQCKPKREHSPRHRNGSTTVLPNIDVDTRQERYCSVDNGRMGRSGTLGSTVKSNTGAEGQGAILKAKRDCSYAEDTLLISTEESSRTTTKHDTQVAARQHKTKREHSPRHGNGRTAVSPKTDFDARRERYCSVEDSHMARSDNLGSVMSNTGGERQDGKSKSRRDGSSAEDAFTSSTEESSGTTTKHDKEVAARQHKPKREHSPRHRNERATVAPNIDVDTRRERYCLVEDRRMGRSGTLGSTKKSSAGVERRDTNYNAKTKANRNSASAKEGTNYTSTDDNAGAKTKHKVKQRKSKGQHSPQHRNGRVTVQLNVDVGTSTEQQLPTMPVCMICEEQTAAITFLPCGHLVCCEDCANRIQKCPVCMKMILGRVCFTSILNKVMETPLFAHWGGQQGGVMSQIMYTEDINKGTSTEQQLPTMPVCMICEEQTAAITFLPCGHLVCCEDCANRIQKCPVCMKMILGRVRTFMS